MTQAAPPAIAPAPVVAPVPPRSAIPPGWLLRRWPRLGVPAAGRAVIATALTAILAGCVLVLTRPGIGWLLVAVAVAACGGVAARGTRTGESLRRRVERWAWATASIAFIAVGTLRADGLLFTWCVFAALACGSVALAGGCTFRGLAAGSAAIVIAAGRGIPWWGRGLARMGRRGSGGVRIGRTIAVSVGLLVVFGLLFATADPEFAHLLAGAEPTLSGSETGRAIAALLLAGPIAVGIAYLASDRAPFHQVGPMRAAPVRRAEWAVPLIVLDVLFLAFVLVQLATLFGGRGRVLATAGLTYAQYARSGFWQLLVIAGLTLVVIAVAARVAPRADSADRLLLRLLLGLLAGLTLVIVASALQRLAVYDNEYGYTRLRLAVGVTEVWLGLVFVFVLVAGVRLRAAWMPRAVGATAALALLATALVGPDQFIANRDVDRYERTGRIDLSYLVGLSADAVPALDRLPPQQRACLLVPMHWRLVANPEDWRSWNLGRAQARTLFRAPDAVSSVPGGSCQTY